MATGQLLSEFPPVKTEDWEAAIAADLKGASYEEKLIWRAREGVVLKPYYRAEDLAGRTWIDAAPGEFPFARGAQAKAGWRIREEIAGGGPEEANRRARDAVTAGAEEIAFRDVVLANTSDVVLLLTNLAEIPVCYSGGNPPRLELLREFLNKESRTATIGAGMDPLADLDSCAALVDSAPAILIPFTIEIERTAPEGANPTEQLGWALAACIEWIAALEREHICADRAAQCIEFAFAIGANYFYEIARLRAFRMLWARVVESFGGSREKAQARIAAHTSNQPASSDASHWNMLRATTESMAAILGGADSVCVTPWTDSDAARRLARNTQLILKHEAMFARVADAGGGAYYLERLTEEIATRAWESMQGIEARGGWRKARA